MLPDDLVAGTPVIRYCGCTGVIIRREPPGSWHGDYAVQPSFSCALCVAMHMNARIQYEHYALAKFWSVAHFSDAMQRIEA